MELRGHLHYGKLANLLSYVRRHTRGCSIGIPYKMGCDRAGGDWEIVCEIIEVSVLERDDIKVTAYMLE